MHFINANMADRYLMDIHYPIIRWFSIAYPLLIHWLSVGVQMGIPTREPL